MKIIVTLEETSFICSEKNCDSKLKFEGNICLEFNDQNVNLGYHPPLKKPENTIYIFCKKHKV